MSTQTSVSSNFAVALAGEPRGNGYQTQTRMAAVAIQNGLFCCQGSRDETCKLPTSAAEVGKGVGIARPSVSRDPNFNAGTPGVTYQIGDAVELTYRGQVWVQVEEAVAPMDPVFVRWNDGNGGLVQKGAFRKSADAVSAAATATAVTGARYLTTAAALGMALVDFNLPQ